MQYFKTALKIGIVLAVLWGLKRWLEWKSLYYPRKEIRSTPQDLGLKYKDIELVTADDHRIHAWWITATDAIGTIIMCHGNAGNIGDRIELIGDLHRMQVNVLIFDYRGYGNSQGLSSEKGTYQDAAAAYEWVRTAQYDDAENPPVIVYGRSLGGAVATQLALEKPVRGVILESTFTSLRDMAKALYPVPGMRWLVSQQYDTISKIDRINAPLLIAHGQRDDLVPFFMGKALFEKAQEPKQFVPLNGGHNDASWHTTSGYWEQFTSFIQKHLSSSDNAVK